MINSVAVVGNCYFDEIYLINDFPHPDDKIIAKDVITTLGGGASNVCTGLAKLKLPTSLFTLVGNDKTANHLINELVSRNININHIQKKDGQSGRTIILLDNSKSSTKIGFHGVCSDLSLLNFEELTSYSHIHFSSTRISTVLKGLKYKKDQSYSLDFGAKTIDAEIEDLFAVIERLDIVFMNRSIFKKLYKISLDKISSINIKYNLIVTAGEKGIYAMIDKIFYHQEIIETDVVDTTGAGDATAAAIIYGFINKYDASMILKLGVAAASLKIRNFGGSIGHEDIDTIIKLIKEKL